MTPAKTSAAEIGPPAATPKKRGAGSQRRRPRPSHQPARRAAKRTPEHQVAFLEQMITSYATRMLAEDPEVGLAGILHLAEVLRGEVRRVGREHVRLYGASEVARAIGRTPQSVWERWADHDGNQ